MAEKNPSLKYFNENSLEQEILRMCKADTIKEMKFKQCLDFGPLQSEIHYCPFENSNYKQMLFDAKRSKIAMKKIDSKETKVINLWKKPIDIAAFENTNVGSAALLLSRKYCRITMENNYDYDELLEIYNY